MSASESTKCNSPEAVHSNAQVMGNSGGKAGVAAHHPASGCPLHRTADNPFTHRAEKLSAWLHVSSDTQSRQSSAFGRQHVTFAADVRAWLGGTMRFASAHASFSPSVKQQQSPAQHWS